MKTTTKDLVKSYTEQIIMKNTGIRLKVKASDFYETFSISL